MAALIELRALTRHILDEQLNGIDDDGLKQLQAELNTQYDRFVRKYGPINGRYNARLFGDDADFPLLSAIEHTSDDGAVTKAAIFSKRTIMPPSRVTHVDTAVEALSVSLNEKGRINERDGEDEHDY